MKSFDFRMLSLGIFQLARFACRDFTGPVRPPECRELGLSAPDQWRVGHQGDARAVGVPAMPGVDEGGGVGGHQAKGALDQHHGSDVGAVGEEDGGLIITEQGAVDEAVCGAGGHQAGRRPRMARAWAVVATGRS